MNQNNSTGFSTELDIKSLLYRFLYNWYWFVLGGLLAIFGAWTYLRYTPTIYNIEGTLLIREDEKSGLSQEVLIEELGYKEATNLNNELQILKSRSLMRKVIDELGMNIAYFVEGRLLTTESYQDKPVIVNYVDPIDKAYGRTLNIVQIDSSQFYLIKAPEDTVVHTYNVPFQIEETIYSLKYQHQTPYPIQIQFRHPEGIAQYYANKLAVRVINRSDVLQLGLQDLVPEKAIEIIHKLVEVYNQDIVSDKKRVANNTLAFIDERLKYLTQELFEVEKRVENIKRGSDLAVDFSGGATRLLDKISSADEMVAELTLKEELLIDLRNRLLTSELKDEFISISADLGGPTINGFITKFNEIVSERKNMLISVSPTNPTIRILDEQLAEIKLKVVEGINIAQEEIINRKEFVKGQIDPIVAQLNQIPKNERRLLEVMRQQQIKESLFLFLLQKKEETALSLAAQIADSKMIDAPTNKGPVAPNRNRIFMLSLLLGLGIPAGLLYLKEINDIAIYNEKDIKAVTKTPFLGMIGQSKTKESIVVRPGSRTPIAEMFRSLRTNLDFMMPSNGGSKCKVVLITSSMSGEGKTFVSINLGASLALSGAKVLLLGMDLRKPKLAKYISNDRKNKGISNYLVGATDDLNELILAVPDVTNLSYIPSGPIPPNPAELLGNDRTNLFFTQLKEKFDYILIDTAPLIVTDALLIGKYARTSLLISRFKKTTKAQIQFFDEIYQSKKLPFPSIVLNGAKRSKRYGYYGYNYGYGNGYYQEEKKRWKVKLPI